MLQIFSLLLLTMAFFSSAAPHQTNSNGQFGTNWNFLATRQQAHLSHCSTFFIGLRRTHNMTSNDPTKDHLELSQIVPEFVGLKSNKNLDSNSDFLIAEGAVKTILEVDDRQVGQGVHPAVTPFLPGKAFEVKEWKRMFKKYSKFCTTIFTLFDLDLVVNPIQSETKPIREWHQISNHGTAPHGLPPHNVFAVLKSIINPRFYPMLKRDEDYFIFISHLDTLEGSSKSKIFGDMTIRLTRAEIAHSLLLLFVPEEFNLRLIIQQICLLCHEGETLMAVSHGNSVTSKFQSHNFDHVFKPWKILRDFFPKTIFNLDARVLRVSITTGIPSRIALEKIDPQLDPYGRTHIMTRGMYNYAMEEFQEKLNFTSAPFPSSARGVNKPGGSGNLQKDGTWSGVIGDVFNYRADFGFLCGETVTRYAFTELPGAIEFIFLTFTTGKESPIYTWMAVLWPFSPEVWVCCCLSFVLGAIFIVVTERIENRDDLGKKTYVSTGRGTIRVTRNDSMLDSMEFVIFGFFDAPTDMHGVGMFKVQLFTSCWCLMGVVISTVYRGILVGLLAFPLYPHVPKNFDELAVSDYRIALQHYGGSAYEQIMYSPNPSLVSIRQRMYLEPSPYECYKAAVPGKFGCIDYGTFGDYIVLLNFTTHGRTDLKIQHSRDYFLPVGPMFRRRSYLMESFRWAIGKVFDAGLTNRWIKMDYNDVQHQKFIEEQLTDPSKKRRSIIHDDGVIFLRLANFEGAFTILFVGFLGGLAFFIGETSIFYYAPHIFHRHMRELILKKKPKNIGRSITISNGKPMSVKQSRRNVSAPPATAGHVREDLFPKMETQMPASVFTYEDFGRSKAPPGATNHENQPSTSAKGRQFGPSIKIRPPSAIFNYGEEVTEF